VEQSRCVSCDPNISEQEREKKPVAIRDKCVSISIKMLAKREKDRISRRRRRGWKKRGCNVFAAQSGCPSDAWEKVATSKCHGPWVFDLKKKDEKN